MPSRSSSVVRILLLAALGLAAGCSSADDAADTNTSDADTSDAGTSDVSAEERCEANRAAGQLTYLSGFDFAASPGIIDVVVADEMGWFEELCLDVRLLPSFSPGNLGLVATGEAQFANAGSFGDMVTVNVNGEADLVTIAQYGKTAVQALVVPDDSGIESLEQISGTTMGIKGDLPPDIEVMLAGAGVSRGDFAEVEVPFDPIGAFELGIDALPVYLSNEPLQLDAAGFGYRVFDPSAYDVPSSFGVLVTSRSFLNQHPTAVQDFVRASLRGYAYAVEQPDEAVDIAVARINAGENAAFLALETERPRWQVESALVTASTADGEGPGIPESDRLGAQVEGLTTIGRFDTLPDWEPMVIRDLAADLYDGTELIWPE